MSVFQDNAATFATTADTAVDQERNAARQRALRLIDEGRPGRALYELARSAERQARMAGAGAISVAPTCPCGGRCRP